MSSQGFQTRIPNQRAVRTTRSDQLNNTSLAYPATQILPVMTGGYAQDNTPNWQSQFGRDGSHDGYISTWNPLPPAMSIEAMQPGRGYESSAVDPNTGNGYFPNGYTDNRNDIGIGYHFYAESRTQEHADLSSISVPVNLISEFDGVPEARREMSTSPWSSQFQSAVAPRIFVSTPAAVYGQSEFLLNPVWAGQTNNSSTRMEFPGQSWTSGIPVPNNSHPEAVTPTGLSNWPGHECISGLYDVSGASTDVPNPIDRSLDTRSV